MTADEQHPEHVVRHFAAETGRRRRVGRGRVVERVTHWEDGRAVGLEVSESDWPIRFMRWVTRIEPSGNGSRISQTLEYAVRFGPVGWLLDALVMKRKLSGALDDVFARLARRAEARSGG